VTVLGRRRVERPRLCFVVESGTDVRLVEGLAERFEVTVLARRIEGGREISHQPTITVATIVGAPSRQRFGALIMKYLLQLRGRIDLVMVQGYGLAALATNLAGRVTGIPAVMLVCSPAEAYYRCRKINPEPRKSFKRGELLSIQLLARANAVVGRKYIVLSRYLADVVNGHGARGRVDVVPVYGVDLSMFVPPVLPKSDIKTKLGLPSTGSLIFFGSRIAPEKDANTLLEAIRSVVDSGRELWVLHRSGGYQVFLEQAKRFRLSGRVIATDAVHPHRDLPRDYQACDLFVQASLAEGLGFAPLEALACGVPVIAASVGGLRETIVEGRTGWTYPPGDSRVLALRIREALDDQIEATRRAAAGRDLVSARYERRRVFQRLTECLECSEPL
jgi:glycosyltransferase involved in cell wall biosynthesis